MKWLFLLLSLSAISLLGSVTESLALGSIGLPMVKVQLTDEKGSVRTCRFLIDTGSDISMLDRGLVASFAVVTKVEAEIVSASGGKTVARHLRLRHMAFGETSLTDVEAVEIDIATTFGAFEDGPLEGVLGMNALRGLRFELDFPGSKIVWGAPLPEGLHVANLRWSSTGLPLVRLAFPNKRIDLTCDTGFTDFVDLLEIDLGGVKVAPGGNETGITMDVAGSVIQGSSFNIAGVVTIGNKGWLNPKVDVMKTGNSGLLGMGAFQPRVWFDLGKGRIGLPVGLDGNLCSTPPLRCPIAVSWVAREGKRQLIVLAVKPHSPYEKAGVKAGDRLVQVDDLHEDILSIQRLREKLNFTEAKRLVVERERKCMVLEVSSGM